MKDLAPATHRRRLFDIRLTIVRALTYLLAVMTMMVLYAALLFIATRAVLVTDTVLPQWAYLLTTLIVAFVFHPAVRFYNRLLADMLYTGSYSADEFYTSLHRVLTTTVKLHDLLAGAARVIGANLKADHISFFVYQSNGHPLSVGSKGHVRPTVYDMHMLDAYLQSTDATRILLTDDVPPRHDIHRLLVGYHVALTVPLVQGGSIIGYLLLGKKRQGTYTRQDVRVLEKAADELAIAVQNAASVEEVRKLNANLQQRIDAATVELRASNEQLRSLDIAKDEFVSMASHQLRTPLTSVKGYISMVLEGDGGRVTKVQKQLLSEAFASSERMVHLINDFLNVSRVQTGKFMIDRHEVDLAKVVRQEVELLKRTAETRGLTLKTKLPPKPVKLQLDEGKIRQVIMNFIDNAIYYSRPGTDIVVALEVTTKEVRLEVVDKGIGVPTAQQAGLFTKFFRADNARTQRPDGTGVGLYLAKMVIDGHDGKIIFSSKEGVGSTFGFRLPLKESAGQDADDADHQQRK